MACWRADTRVAVLHGLAQAVLVQRLPAEQRGERLAVQAHRGGGAAQQEAGAEVVDHLLPGGGRGVVSLVDDDKAEAVRLDLPQPVPQALHRGDQHRGRPPALAGQGPHPPPGRDQAEGVDSLAEQLVSMHDHQGGGLEVRRQGTEEAGLPAPGRHHDQATRLAAVDGLLRRFHGGSLLGPELAKGDPHRQLWQQQRKRCQRFEILDARLPAILRKSEKPANAAEQIEFARLCLLKKLHAAAAGFFAAAFAMKPELAKDPRTGCRYDAACSAALAGCGRGADGAEQSDAERARWRAQARRWLRADLDAWARRLESGLAVDRATVQERLAWWRKDPDLAGLRDQDALGKLPPAERQECRALWTGVEALLQRARGLE